MSAGRVPGLPGPGGAARSRPVPGELPVGASRARLGLLAAPAAGAGRRARPWVLTGWALEGFSGPGRRRRGRRAAPCVRVSPARFPPVCEEEGRPRVPASAWGFLLPPVGPQRRPDRRPAGRGARWAEPGLPAGRAGAGGGPGAQRRRLRSWPPARSGRRSASKSDRMGIFRTSGELVLVVTSRVLRWPFGWRGSCSVRSVLGGKSPGCLLGSTVIKMSHKREGEITCALGNY